MRRCVFALGWVMLVAGCTTVGLPEGSERPTDSSSLLSGYSPTGDAKIRVTRVSRAFGAACAMRVYANGKPIADLDSGRSVEFGVGVGPISLRAHFAERGLCPGQLSTLALTMVKGGNVNVVFDLSPNGQQVFQVID